MKVHVGQQLWMDPERTYIGYEVLDGRVSDVRHVEITVGQPSIVLSIEELILNFSEHETLHVFVRLLLSDGSTTLLSRGVVEEHGRVLTSSTVARQ